MAEAEIADPQADSVSAERGRQPGEEWEVQQTAEPRADSASAERGRQPSEEQEVPSAMQQQSPALVTLQWHGQLGARAASLMRARRAKMGGADFGCDR